ncbi:piezo-type mechanosensitive ion channel component 2-like [Narcine bancroftii]|uniref:piezo-type mechanosensitive ion channel component 2-like n=1 Tax=Narcine bancroftii TaxID=1343680 RepID=UPI003831923D
MADHIHLPHHLLHLQAHFQLPPVDRKGHRHPSNFTFYLCRCQEEVESTDSEEETSSESESIEDEEEETLAENNTVNKERFIQKLMLFMIWIKELIGDLIITAGKPVFTILLCFAGIVHPSLISAVYFVTFLGLCTWWACVRPFSLFLFKCLCVLMLFFSSAHLALIYVYQLPLFQGLVPPSNIWMRLFGLTAVIHTNVSEPWQLITHQGLRWPVVLNPMVLLVLYFIVATLTRQLLLNDESGAGIARSDVSSVENLLEEIDSEANLRMVVSERKKHPGGDYTVELPVPFYVPQGNNNCLQVQMYCSPENTSSSGSAATKPAVVQIPRVLKLLVLWHQQLVRDSVALPILPVPLVLVFCVTGPRPELLVSLYFLRVLRVLLSFSSMFACCTGHQPDPIELLFHSTVATLLAHRHPLFLVQCLIFGFFNIAAVGHVLALVHFLLQAERRIDLCALALCRWIAHLPLTLMKGLGPKHWFTLTSYDAPSASEFSQHICVPYHNRTNCRCSSLTSLRAFSDHATLISLSFSSTDACQEAGLPEDGIGKPRSSLSVIGQMLMQQSYTCALIFMMVWSVTYNSWLTFALLIWSCVIWMVRGRQRWSKITSPALVIYGNLLVSHQFFVGLQLTTDEVFPGASDAVLVDFDLKHSNTPCVHLAAKIFYSLTFWLLLRQHLTEKREMSQRAQGSLGEVRVQGAEGAQKDGSLLMMIGCLVKGLLIKYWIYFCAAMFFIVSFNGRVVVYKILYIKLFLFCVALYQIHYERWRQILRYFWITVVSYSMMVLIAIYTYQFRIISWLFQRILGMSEDSLKDLGLEQHDTTKLFAHILLPSTFLLTCILQLHYFHDHFLRLTDLKLVSPSQGSITCRVIWIWQASALFTWEHIHPEPPRRNPVALNMSYLPVISRPLFAKVATSRPEDFKNGSGSQSKVCSAQSKEKEDTNGRGAQQRSGQPQRNQLRDARHQGAQLEDEDGGRGGISIEVAEISQYHCHRKAHQHECIATEARKLSKRNRSFGSPNTDPRAHFHTWLTLCLSVHWEYFHCTPNMPERLWKGSGELGAEPVTALPEDLCGRSNHISGERRQAILLTMEFPAIGYWGKMLDGLLLEITPLYQLVQILFQALKTFAVHNASNLSVIWVQCWVSGAGLSAPEDHSRLASHWATSGPLVGTSSSMGKMAVFPTYNPTHNWNSSASTSQGNAELNDKHSEDISSRSAILEKLRFEDEKPGLELEDEPDTKGNLKLPTTGSMCSSFFPHFKDGAQTEDEVSILQSASDLTLAMRETMGRHLGKGMGWGIEMGGHWEVHAIAVEVLNEAISQSAPSPSNLEETPAGAPDADSQVKCFFTWKDWLEPRNGDVQILSHESVLPNLHLINLYPCYVSNSGRKAEPLGESHAVIEKTIKQTLRDLNPGPDHWRCKGVALIATPTVLPQCLTLFLQNFAAAVSDPCPWSMVIDRLTTLFLKFLELMHQAQVLMWRLLELHIIEIVSSCIIWITLREVSLMNYVFFILWVFALPYSSFRPLASSISTVWACVMIICKMMYQLKIVNLAKYSTNCTLVSMIPLFGDNLGEQVPTSVLYAGPIDPMYWYGALRKCEEDVMPCVKNHLIILALLVFEVTVYRHQLHYRLHNGLKTPLTGTLLDNITRLHLDDGLWSCIKYFINNFFYKFGLEVCFMMAVNVIGQRMDMYSAVHGLCLTGILWQRRRKAIAEVWPKYCCFIACVTSFQYLLCVGIPPSFCKDYPWRSSLGLSSNLIKWLYLPDFMRRPNPLFLVYDFMLLLSASKQWQVFEDENKAGVRLIAGENTEIGRSLDPTTISQYVPVANFLHCRSYLDMLKVVIFSYLFWFVLCLIFITGTSRINIFCMGYLVACFYFLLAGGQLLLKPVKIIVNHWDYLIGYTLLVIMTKNIFSIGSCVYLKNLLERNCWVVQTFGMACTIKDYDLPNTDNLHETCEVPSKQAGIIWDSVCLLFLLAQRRVFLSYYFLHVVADLKASKLLAARGAELFEAKIKKRVSLRLEKENLSMVKLKRQMERIKAKQEKYKQSKKQVAKSVKHSGTNSNEKPAGQESCSVMKTKFFPDLCDVPHSPVTLESAHLREDPCTAIHPKYSQEELSKSTDAGPECYTETSWRNSAGHAASTGPGPFLIKGSGSKRTTLYGAALGECSWTQHTNGIMKKVRQHLYLLRSLQKFGMTLNILTDFYRCVVEGVLTSCIMARKSTWNATAGEQQQLSRVHLTQDSLCSHAAIRKEVCNYLSQQSIVLDVEGSQISKYHKYSCIMDFVLLKITDSPVSIIFNSSQEMEKRKLKVARRIGGSPGYLITQPPYHTVFVGAELNRALVEVIHSASYYLFDTDSEDEANEESESVKEAAQKSSAFQKWSALRRSQLQIPCCAPATHSRCFYSYNTQSQQRALVLVAHLFIKSSEFAYMALVKDSKAAVKERHKELKQVKKAQRKKERVQRDVSRNYSSEDELDPLNAQEEGPQDTDNLIGRGVNILTFTWMFIQALIEGLIELLNTISKDNIDISTVLRMERSILRRDLKQSKTRNGWKYLADQVTSVGRETKLKIQAEDPSPELGKETGGAAGEGKSLIMENWGDRENKLQTRSSGQRVDGSRWGKILDQDSIHRFYDSKLKSQASCCSDGVWTFSGAAAGDGATVRGFQKLTSPNSTFSRDSSVSSLKGMKEFSEGKRWLAHSRVSIVRCSKPGDNLYLRIKQLQMLEIRNYSWKPSADQAGCKTEVTTLDSRQNTADNMDEAEELTTVVPRSGNRSRWKLQKMSHIDMSCDSDLISAPPHSVLLHSEQGASETRGEGEGKITATSCSPGSDVLPGYSTMTGSRSEEGLYTEPEEQISKGDQVPPTQQSRLLTASDLMLKKMFHDTELEESDKFYSNLPCLLKLLLALYNIVMSQSDMLCYFTMILNHMVSASLLTLVLPILVFLWAMLSIPRPKKRFWMFAILYTKITVVVKYCFQFGFFPWTTSSYRLLYFNQPFYLPNIIGIEKKDGYVHCDLIQLLALFLHRSVLKCHGLWDSHDAVKERRARKGQSLGEVREENSHSETQPTGGFQDTVRSVGRTSVSRRKSGRLDRADRRKASKRSKKKKGEPPKIHSGFKEAIKEQIREKGRGVKRSIVVLTPFVLFEQVDFSKAFDKSMIVHFPTLYFNCHFFALSPNLSKSLCSLSVSLASLPQRHFGIICKFSHKAIKFPHPIPLLTCLSMASCDARPRLPTNLEDQHLIFRLDTFQTDSINIDFSGFPSMVCPALASFCLSLEEGLRAKTSVIYLSLQIFLPVKQFFHNIIHPEYNAVCDVYALMFLIDVINFIIIVFGYWAFGKHSVATDITEFISEDHVPQVFLVMVLVQFASMVVDRALYLRKTVLGKVVFQVVLVIGVHFWMFFLLPGMTQRRFNQNQIAQLWYFVKCIYFGLSAYQIKCGYPNRVLGNFLTKSYNYFNLFLFQGFRLVPFLMELRAVMDWMWTDTTLSISSWICVEDIYANTFILKCWNESEKRYPQAVGQKKNMLVKYGMGGLVITLLICIVWFPLLFMSLVKTVGGVTNQPLDVSIKIFIGGYEPLFTMSAQQQNLRPFSPAEYDQLTSQYSIYPSTMQFLVNYLPEDIVVANIKSDATLLWSISPASLRAMKEEIINSSQVQVHLHWTILRNSSLLLNPETFGKHTVLCTEKEVREELVQLLEGSRKKSVVIKELFPKYIRATDRTEAKPAFRLRLGAHASRNDQSKLAFYRNISLQLEEEPGQGNTTYTKVKWWNIKEWSPHCASQGCGNMELIIFNDKVSPSSLGFLTGYGIIGLYMSVVLVIGKFVREFFNGISRSIMFEELPNPDRILKLCTDIFLVREMGELELEEQLFAKLIFLYRSPETMIKWTRE